MNGAFSLNEVITLVLSIIAILVSIISFSRSEKRTVKENTVKAYVDLQKFLYFLYEYSPREIEDFVDDKGTEEYKILSTAVAQIELFAIAVKNRLYDFETVYDMSHGYLDKTLRSRIEYIIDFKGNKARTEYYKNTIWLLEAMDEKGTK